MKPLNILLACEESQAVTIEMRKRGHNAFSCDIQECSGSHPEWHIQGDVIEQLCNGWDMMIAFPPCTHLALSGAKHFEKKRQDGRQKSAIDFFMTMINAPIDKIAVENPMGIISGGEYIKEHYPGLAEKHGLPLKPTQIIHPYYFGDEAQKTTCLWLKNLPPLQHWDSDNLFYQKTHTKKGEFVITKSGKKLPKWYSDLGGGKKGGARSKTFPGIARAMAEQWTPNLNA